MSTLDEGSVLFLAARTSVYRVQTRTRGAPGVALSFTAGAEAGVHKKERLQ